MEHKAGQYQHLFRVKAQEAGTLSSPCVLPLSLLREDLLCWGLLAGSAPGPLHMLPLCLEACPLKLCLLPPVFRCLLSWSSPEAFWDPHLAPSTTSPLISLHSARLVPADLVISCSLETLRGLRRLSSAHFLQLDARQKCRNAWSLRSLSLNRRDSNCLIFYPGERDPTHKLDVSTA